MPEIKLPNCESHKKERRTHPKTWYRVNSKDKAQYVNVVITSFPVAADIEVDGVFYGGAGEKISIACGVRHICVSLPGYGRWEKEIVFSPGAKVSIHAQLAKSADFRIINE